MTMMFPFLALLLNINKAKPSKGFPGKGRTEEADTPFLALSGIRETLRTIFLQFSNQL
jgi:hypothetical protein